MAEHPSEKEQLKASTARSRPEDSLKPDAEDQKGEAIRQEIEKPDLLHQETDEGLPVYPAHRQSIRFRPITRASEENMDHEANTDDEANTKDTDKGSWRPFPTGRVFTGGDSNQKHLKPALQKAIEKARRIDLAVSFLMETGVKELLPDLKRAAERGVPIRILCGNYLGITQPAALSLLEDELKDQMELHFYEEERRSFHPKSYIFYYEEGIDVFIGSSNLSRSALTRGIEWNYRLSSQQDFKGVQEFIAEFENLFLHHSYILTEEKLKAYQASWKRPQLYKDLEKASWQEQLPDPIGQDQQQQSTSKEREKTPVEPRDAQIEALIALKNTRKRGATRALVQAATGVGKTYLAAFDSRDFKRVLFVAHRQEILQQARESFMKVRGIGPDQTGFFQGDQKDQNVSILFASVQTLGKAAHLQTYFQPDSFDYIIIDEFHHAAADTYQRIVHYFQPAFLLGLTATPERMDGRNIYEICEYNVPYRIDLPRAIDRGLLAPFHYYGLYDKTDYSTIAWSNGKYNERSLLKAYTSNQDRFDLIYKNYRKYGSARAIGFCSSQEHAIAMTKDFQKRGIKAAALLSGIEDGKICLNRKEALEKLQKAELNVLFVVDILNEGVDVPLLDMVMFLRPTESPVIFLQQLGRGLRKAPGKEYLNVLDFLGNYKNVSRIPSLLVQNQEPSSRPFMERYQHLQSLLPVDCLLDLDFELIDLFEEMEKSRISGRMTTVQALQQIDEEYERIKALLHKVPSRGDLLNYMEEDILELCRKKSALSPFKNYLAFRNRHQDLSLSQQSLMNSPAGKFLEMLETTQMTKVYKMPILLSFLQESRMKAGLTKGELLEGWKAFFGRNENWRDLPRIQTYQAYLEIPDKDHLDRILKNPVKFLIQSGKGFFTATDDHPIHLADELIPYLENEDFIHEFEDIVLYRANDYYKWRLNKD